MVSDACEELSKLRVRHYVLIGLILLPVVITLPGWIAAGIWGMHIFLKTICIFWPVVGGLALAGAVWIGLDPHSN